MINMKKRPPATRHRAAGKRGPEATRQALLRAGAELFAERGFDGVPIEEVADRAGVNKALISYHFRGKRGLYVAILESAFAAMAERLKAIEAGALDAREALHGLRPGLRRDDAREPRLPHPLPPRGAQGGDRQAVLPHLLEIIGVSRRLAERGAREGLFRPVDPLLMHFGLVGSLVFFFATEPARRRAAAQARVPFALPDSSAFLRYLEELTLRGLAPEKPPSRRRKGARA